MSPAANAYYYPGDEDEGAMIEFGLRFRRAVTLCDSHTGDGRRIIEHGDSATGQLETEYDETADPSGDDVEATVTLTEIGAFDDSLVLGKITQVERQDNRLREAAQ